MNASFKSIWNEALGAWIAAGENTMARGKRSSSKLAAVIVAAAVLLQVWPQSAYATTYNPIGCNATGTATIGRTSFTGTNAFAIDGSGTWSNVIGCNASANGVDAGTVTGSYSQVTGTGGAAFGFASKAGTWATAAGLSALASGTASSAFGFGSIASASNSVAIGGAGGNGTTALSAANSTTAAGAGSIAIGSNATKGAQASATDAIAIGGQSAVTGTSTSGIAVGRGATVNGVFGIAQGDGVVAGATGQNVAIGSSGTTANSSTSAGGAVAIGRAQTANGNGAVAIGDPNTSTGTGAVAVGADNTANGTGAAAIGNLNTAIGQGSVAVGNSSQANAAGSLALGDTATASSTNSVAIGTNAITVGASSVAIGNGAKANGGASDINSIAIGTGATSFGQSFALGTGANADQSGYAQQNSSVAIGALANTTNNTTRAIALGVGATVDSSTVIDAAMALGAGAKASATNGMALGTTANAYGLNAVAGVNGTSTIANDIALGNGARATAGDSIAIGTSAVASSAGAVAIGKRATANGGQAVSIGAGNVASGNGAVAIGDPNTATGNGTIAQGKDNTANGDGTVAMGNINMVGGGGQAIGVPGTAAAQGAVGIGFTNTVVGKGAVALGSTNTATGQGSVAIGNTSQAKAAGAVALGDAAIANNAKDVALGSGSVTAAAVGTGGATIAGTAYSFAGIAPASTVSVGAAGAERTITNVAAGRISATSTDAINGSQLFATNSAINAVSTTANKGWNLQANGGAADNIAPGDTVNVVNGSNTTASYNAATNQLKVDVVASPTFTNLTTTGNTAVGGTLNVTGASTLTGGATVSNNLTVSPATTVNMGGNVVTNVAPGVAGTDAVNVNQLGVVSTTASKGWNLQANGGTADNIAPGDTVNVVNGSNTTASYNAATNQLKVDVVANPTFTSLTANNLTVNGSTVLNGGTTVSNSLTVGGGTTINMGGNSISNVAPGVNNTDVVNVSQLNATKTHYYSVNATDTSAGSNYNNDGATGTNALAAGVGAAAVGASSVAVGAGSKAQAAGTLALGSGATAVGADAIAMGTGATAPGNLSIAIGQNAQSLGSGVAGWGTVAIGDDSFVNANSVAGVAVGSGAHVDSASGVALGGRTSAQGTNSVAIGYLATANGANSIAAGISAQAVHDNSIALGDSTLTSAAVATPSAIINGKAYNFAGALPMGTLSVGNASTGQQRQIQNVAAGRFDAASTDAINGSQLYGTSQAIESVAVTASKGWNLQANGGAADNIAPGDTVNVVNGSNTTASYNAATNQLKMDVVANPTFSGTVTANGGLAVGAGQLVDMGGNKVTNVAAGAAATDAVNVSQLNTAVAAGKTKYYSVNSTGGGNVNNDGATGLDAIAAGKDATATMQNSAAVGLAARAQGVDALALGARAHADAEKTTAVGTDAQATGQFATAIGDDAQASNTHALALGTNSRANGVSSSAFGQDAQASGDYSVAFGSNSRADGSSTATGQNANAKTVDGQGFATAVGNSAVANKVGATAVGAGSQATGDRSFAAAADATASGTLAIAIGTGAQATGQRSISIGTGNVVSGDNSGAIGDPSIINGANSYSVGNNNTIGAGADNVFVLGNNVNIGTNITGAVALGNQSGVTVSGGVALGELSIASTPSGMSGYDSATGTASTNSDPTWRSTASAVSVGGGIAGGVVQTRQITNVAAGAVDTDAVNVAQLKRVGSAASAGWNVQANGDTATNVAPGGKVQFLNGQNIAITRNGTDITLATTPNLTANSVTINGGPTINSGGIALNAGNTVNMGGNTITNVGVGINPGDAVNVGQLTTLANMPLTFTGNTGTVDRRLGQTLAIQGSATTAGTYAGANINTVVDPATGTVNVQMADAPVFGSLTTTGNATVGGSLSVAGPTTLNGGLNMAGNQITNVAAGTAGTDAVNLNQLNTVSTVTSKGWNVQANGGAADNIAPGDTVNVVSGSNTTASYNAATKQLKVDLVADPSFNSVTTNNLTATGVTNLNTLNVTGPTNLSGGTTIRNSLTVNPGTTVNMGGNQITNVAAGTANTDAVNVSQLTMLGNTPLTFTGNAGTVQRKLGEELVIKGDATTAGTYSGANVKTEVVGNEVRVQMADAPVFAGQVKANGFDANGQKIVSVAAGTAGTDAVNFSQLKAVATVADNSVQYDDSTKNSVTLGGAGNGHAPVTVTNVAPGALSPTSTDAVNGSQLNATNQNITSVTNAVNNIAGDTSTSYTMANGLGIKYARTNDTGLTPDDAHATVAGATALGYNATASHDQSVAIGRDSLADGSTLGAAAYNPGTGTLAGVTPVGEVSVGKAGAERRVTNVAAGAEDTDAVNVSQLRVVSSAVAVAGDKWIVGSPTAYLAPTSVGTNSTAVGSGASVYVSNAVAVGTGASATTANSVALGNNSNTAAAVATTGTMINGTSYNNFAGAAPTGVVSVGNSAAGETRQVTNVAAGQLNATSTDAVNGSQLYATNQAVNNLGTTVNNLATSVNNLGDTVNTINNGGGIRYFRSNVNDASMPDAAANGAASVAAGSGATTTTAGTNGAAFGINATVDAANSTALGANTRVTVANSVAIGAGAVAVSAAAPVTQAVVGTTVYSGFAGSAPVGVVSVGAKGEERQLSNVAAGQINAASTDAVNGSQLYSVANGLGTQIANIDSRSIKYDTNQDGTVNQNSVTLQGNGGTQIHNVAEGSAGTDAVNVNQLNGAMANVNQQLNGLNQRINVVAKDASAGTAGAMAMASMPQASIPGKSMVSAGVAAYDGQAAIAIGVSKLSDTGRWIAKFSGTANSRGKVGVGAGVGFHW
jgi:autotransporter adhesin